MNVNRRALYVGLPARWYSAIARLCGFALVMCLSTLAAAQSENCSATAASAELIAERLAVMPDVARYKWQHHLPVEDLPRERHLLDAMVAQAAQLGLPADAAAPFVQAQMDASKMIQTALFAKWRAHGTGTDTGTVPDLAKEIRPRITRITAQLLARVAEQRSEPESCATQYADVRKDLREFGAAWQRAYAALRAVPRVPAAE